MTLFNRRKLGDQYEILAADYLQHQGLTLKERNFTTKFGEIDLIMRDKECIVFIEVKYRKNSGYGHAAEFVNRQKSQRLIKTAYIWLNKKGLSLQTTDFRFDVIAIHQEGRDINWIKNAITQE